MDVSIKQIPVVSPDILKGLGVNPTSARTMLSRYEKKGVFTRIKRGYYVNNTIPIGVEEISSILFPESYISLNTVLFESGIIKQLSRALYCVSNRGGYERIDLGVVKLYKYSLSITSRKGISIDGSGNFRASSERALLDSLYFKLFSRYYPGDSEYNLISLNETAINELLPLYPKRVQKYYENLKD